MYYLQIVASLTMCYLAFRLYRLSRKFKRDKLDEVVRQHRRKYGVNDCVNTSVMQQVEKGAFVNDVTLNVNASSNILKKHF